jgi:hypothetical protein
MLTSRKDRLTDILACPLRILPKVALVSSTDSLLGIRELVNDLEHLAIDRSLFPHAQRKVTSSYASQFCLHWLLSIKKHYFGHSPKTSFVEVL